MNEDYLDFFKNGLPTFVISDIIVIFEMIPVKSITERKEGRFDIMTVNIKENEVKNFYFNRGFNEDDRKRFIIALLNRAKSKEEYLRFVDYLTSLPLRQAILDDLVSGSNWIIRGDAEKFISDRMIRSIIRNGGVPSLEIVLNSLKQQNFYLVGPVYEEGCYRDEIVKHCREKDSQDLKDFADEMDIPVTKGALHEEM